MNKKLLIILLLFTTLSYSTEITGNVFLDNISDHSGIVIKFNPVSPSAIYTEGVSSTNGEYSITVVNGVYNISYEKNGYQTYTITNQLISTDDTLSSVTLNSNTAIVVSGDISGNWTNNNTYIVNGDITIPPNQTLNIEPGTEVRFNGYYSLIVNGTLTAVGIENNKIKITSNSTSPTNNDWNQIKINSTSASSEINYCVIEYGHITDFAETGFIEINGEITIINSTIKNSNGPAIKIALNYSGGVLIDNCEINNSNYGIYNSGVGEIFITNNRIFDINTIGVYENIYDSQTTISNNIIYNCPYNGITSHSDILIERNILFNNGHGNPYGAGVFVGDGTPIIANNTMFSNNNGVGIYDNDFYNPQPIINSNIIINNSNYGIISQGVFQPSVVAYNLFNNNTNGVGNNIPVGVGSVITTNANGTGSDAYYNIFSSAQLISTNPTDSNFCELNSISNAINAGNPNIVNNYNSTVIDIGAKESSETLSINEFSNYDIIIYPNPVVNEVKIQSRNTQLFDRIVIYNIKGQIIKEYNLENSRSEYKLENLINLKSGIHLMSIYNNFEKIYEIKLLKK